MKIKLFNAKALGAALIVAALASCSELQTPEGEIIPGDPAGTPTESTLYTAALKTVASSSDRVVMAPRTRADEGAKPGSLTRIATIENPSRQADFANFEKEGRYLSATCVYYDPNTGTYYATYHMQGNNYSTQQTVETAGLIETFTVAEDGTPALGKIYRSDDPSKLDFDFNHLYFDVLNNDYLTYSGSDAGSTRIVAVGHKSEPSSKTDGKPNTAAIIATLNLEESKIDYNVVYTGEKILDQNGKSLGDENAGDANCVLRKADYYYVATRKGIAVLNAKKENLFTPINNIAEDGFPIENNPYFIKTPGSVKHFAHIYTNSHFSCLYLTDETPEDGIEKTTASAANIIDFSMETGYGTLCGSNTSGNSKAIMNAAGFDITGWSLDVNQKPVPAEICPVDGKNVLSIAENGSLKVAALGKSGLYVRNADSYYDGVMTFSDKKEGGTRPVNGVFAEPIEYFNGGRATNGFIYVANGACLTILDASTLETVAEYSAFEDGKQISANYVHVTKTNVSTNVSSPDRIITVAYGQDGVKVFKFIPPTRK